MPLGPWGQSSIPKEICKGLINMINNCAIIAKVVEQNVQLNFSISTKNSVHSHIGVVGIPDFDEKEISLILGIYQLYETSIMISVEDSCKIQHWLMRLLLAFVSVEGYINRFKFPGLNKDLIHRVTCYSKSGESKEKRGKQNSRRFQM